VAWVCVRCERKIYEPRPAAVRFGMLWKYRKKTDGLTVDVINLEKIKRKEVVTHLHCEKPELDGFKDRMRKRLGMPDDRDHPLLI